MNLTSIKTGDIVQADVRGLTFFALVSGKRRGVVRVEPLTKVTHRELSARQIVAHYRKSKASVA